MGHKTHGGRRSSSSLWSLRWCRNQLLLRRTKSTHSSLAEILCPAPNLRTVQDSPGHAPAWWPTGNALWAAWLLLRLAPLLPSVPSLDLDTRFLATALEPLWLRVWIFLPFTVPSPVTCFQSPIPSKSELAFYLEQEKDILQVLLCQASEHRQVVPTAAQSTPDPILHLCL